MDWSQGSLGTGSSFQIDSLAFNRVVGSIGTSISALPWESGEEEQADVELESDQRDS